MAGAWGWGNGRSRAWAFGQDTRTEGVRQRCFSARGNLGGGRGLARPERSVKLRPDHEVGLSVSCLVVRRLGFRVLPVRNREAGPSSPRTEAPCDCPLQSWAQECSPQITLKGMQGPGFPWVVASTGGGPGPGCSKILNEGPWPGHRAGTQANALRRRTSSKPKATWATALWPWSSGFCEGNPIFLKLLLRAG